MTDKQQRHYSRRATTGDIEIVDREFDFVRAILRYDYRYTCNADQWDHAERICAALEGPMVSQGLVVSHRYQEGFVNGSRKTRDELSEIIARKDAEIARLRAALKKCADKERIENATAK